jgi:hypothetical protein
MISQSHSSRLPQASNLCTTNTAFLRFLRRIFEKVFVFLCFYRALARARLLLVTGNWLLATLVTASGRDGLNLLFFAFPYRP